jgi:hypothetical protein
MLAPGAWSVSYKTRRRAGSAAIGVAISSGQCLQNRCLRWRCVRVARCDSVAHSFQRSSKGLIGTEPSELGLVRPRSEDHTDCPVFMCILWMYLTELATARGVPDRISVFLTVFRERPYSFTTRLIGVDRPPYWPHWRTLDAESRRACGAWRRLSYAALLLVRRTDCEVCFCLWNQELAIWLGFSWLKSGPCLDSQ